MKYKKKKTILKIEKMYHMLILKFHRKKIFTKQCMLYPGRKDTRDQYSDTTLPLSYEH